jgi:uncharacterized protein with HEPN domain
VTRSAKQSLADILHAIARSRVADKRLRLAKSLGDDVGLQIAFQAIMLNLSVIGESVSALPVEILEREPGTPWSDFAAMRDATGHDYYRIVPEEIHRTVEDDLGALEAAVQRLSNPR